MVTAPNDAVVKLAAIANAAVPVFISRLTVLFAVAVAEIRLAVLVTSEALEATLPSDNALIAALNAVIAELPVVRLDIAPRVAEVRLVPAEARKVLAAMSPYSASVQVLDACATSNICPTTYSPAGIGKSAKVIG